VSREFHVKLDPLLGCQAPVIGCVWADGIEPPSETTEAPEFLARILADTRAAGETFVPEDVRRRVRTLLRYGSYKPSGRGKPASEYLLRAALEDTFPLVNGPVDVNNAISLASGLPGSLFDADLSGTELLVRHGRAGEAYVFNPSEQTIDLEDLLVVCRKAGSGWTPCGNPVKDSMQTKVRQSTRAIIAVLYAPSDEPPNAVAAWSARYAELLSSHCGAKTSGYEVVSATCTAEEAVDCEGCSVRE
jgi:DNA/RNA-binding domain of Phe-tRNA-synthetase-like protein